MYKRLYKDSRKSLFANTDLIKLIKMTNDEIERVVELMYNMELEDSYDQNTGKVVRLRSEEEELLRFCGGPTLGEHDGRR